MVIGDLGIDNVENDKAEDNWIVFLIAVKLYQFPDEGNGVSNVVEINKSRNNHLIYVHYGC